MATSIITNTLTDLDGTAISGVVVIARLKPGPAFRSSGTEIASQDSTTTNSAGTWSLTLERNSNISPDGSYYEIEEQIPDSSGGLKSWTITVGATNQSLFAALVTTLPATTGPTYLTQASGDARYVQLGSIGGSTPANVTSAAAEGVATSAARADHVHKLDAAVAGDALTLTSGVLHVVPDNSSLEISADTIRNKAGGITQSHLETSVSTRVQLIHYALWSSGVR